MGPNMLYATFRDPVWTHNNGGTLNMDLVREFKPDNARSLDRGYNQARSYADELNTDADLRKKLIDRKPDFARCQTFRDRREKAKALM